MPVWPVAPVEEVPAVTLLAWQVFAVDNDHHLVGWSPRIREGRVTSKVGAFDTDTMTATTRSGRRYELAGPPGFDGDAHYVWESWCAINGIEDSTVTNVTHEYFTDAVEGSS